MIVIVDSNEEATNPAVVDTMRKSIPNLTVAHLTSGDVNVILDNGEVLAVERKNAADFLGSVADGRVFRQVENMANSAKFYCIIIVGEFSFDKEDMVVCNGRTTGWRGISIRGALYAIQFSGCPILFCRSSGYPDYTETLLEIVKFVSKPETHWQMLGHRRIVTFPPIDIQTEIIAAFPGIGLKRAKALLEFAGKKGKRGTLAEALTWASAFPMLAESSMPEGWGKKVANNFRTMLGLADDEYLDIKIVGEK